MKALRIIAMLLLTACSSPSVAPLSKEGDWVFRGDKGEVVTIHIDLKKNTISGTFTMGSIHWESRANSYNSSYQIIQIRDDATGAGFQNFEFVNVVQTNASTMTADEYGYTYAGPVPGTTDWTYYTSHFTKSVT